MRRFTNFVAAGFITLIIFSCGTSPRSTEARNPETAVAEVASAAVSNIEEELFNVIQDWVKSQNQGDFEKYKSFYAASFSGVKRAGANEYKYDVKGWLKDRERMFRKPMQVEAKYLLINYHQAPYRVNFQQLWQSGDFSDYGPKLVTIDSVDGGLKIIGEEMLASKVVATNADTYSALAHPGFFLRRGDNLIVNAQFKPTDLIKTQTSCEKYSSENKLCVKIHHHAIEQEGIDSLLKSSLNKKVFAGNIDTDELWHGVTMEFRAVREELVDSLPGILLPASIFEVRYSWEGGVSKFTNFHPVLHYKAQGDGEVSRGQWAYLSETEPVIYTKEKIEDNELKSAYYARLDSIDNTELLLFTTTDRKFLVSYTYHVECGDIGYEDVKLWNITREDRPLFLTELPDLPTMILDLDRDDDLDILYEEQFRDDPTRHIMWQDPYYALRGQDTVFLTCGC